MQLNARPELLSTGSVSEMILMDEGGYDIEVGRATPPCLVAAHQNTKIKIKPLLNKEALDPLSRPSFTFLSGFRFRLVT